MFVFLLLAPFLAGQAVATDSVSLLKRDYTDNNAFVPGTTPGCPADWPLCGSSGICYNPAEGQTCCPGGTYACPSSSFCLFDPFCCPIDQTPESCANEHGLSLTTSRLSSPEQSQLPTDESSTDPLLPQPTLSLSSASSITISSTPIPTSSIVPWPSLSVTFSPTPGVEEPAYTGAAWRPRRGGDLGLGGAVPVVIGVLGWVV